MKHGKYPKKGADALRQKLIALGIDAPEIAQTQEDTTMLRKQSLLPKTRQSFKIPGDPFGAEVRDADDMFIDENVRYVCESVYMTAKHGGMLGVIGESGSGKSTIRRYLHDRLKREALPIVLIEPYVISMDDEKGLLGRPLRADHIAEAILNTIAPSSRVPRSPEARFRTLHKALKESARAGNRHVLIIEEAHDLHGKTLKQLKRFYELEDGFNRLLSIILFGQSELRAKLGETNSEVREVVQRLELVELRPMNNPEGYIRHRLERAGMKFEAVFAPDAMDALRLKHAGPGAHERGKAREAVSLLYPLAVGNTLIAACNLAAEIGMDKVTGDIINRV
jgi:type II secretory pathway predicted ATPase ExeA